MTLIGCPECSRAVSERAPHCPHCGCPIAQPEAFSDRGAAARSDWQRRVSFSGAALTCLGVFLPVLSAPIFGSINVMDAHRDLGMALLGFAIAGSVLCWRRYYDASAITGAANFAILCAAYWGLRHGIDAVFSSQNDVFSPLERALATGALNLIQLQWGFTVLIVGALLVVAGASPLTRVLGKAVEDKPRNATRVTMSVAAFVIIGCASYSLRGLSKERHEAAAAAAKADSVKRFATAEQEVLELLNHIVTRQRDKSAQTGLPFMVDSTAAGYLKLAVPTGAWYWTSGAVRGYFIHARAGHVNLPGRWCFLIAEGLRQPPFSVDFSDDGVLNQAECEPIPPEGLPTFQPP